MAVAAAAAAAAVQITHPTPKDHQHVAATQIASPVTTTAIAPTLQMLHEESLYGSEMWPGSWVRSDRGISIFEEEFF
jgi:hypothetical protein